jgi:hypothetical protein
MPSLSGCAPGITTVGNDQRAPSCHIDAARNAKASAVTTAAAANTGQENGR